MIGLDTNVLVRYIMQDDPRQSPIATALIDSLSLESPGYVPLIVVVEVSWVLSSAYGIRRDGLAQSLEALLRARELIVEQAELVGKALRLFQVGSADFSDCLIVATATAVGCERIVTFDRVAAKQAGMTLLG